MSEEIKNKREQLSQVNDAISAVLKTGQSYSIGSRTLTRANITELRHLKAELEAEIAQEENNSSLFSNCSVAFFEGR